MADNRVEASGPANGGRGLRVLIENSEYWLSNYGDLAMLAVTVARLRARWPLARIAILTDSPALLRAYFPDCEAITVFDAEPWADAGPYERIASRLGPRIIGPIEIARLRTAAFLSQKSRGARRRLHRAWRALAGRPEPGSSPATGARPTGAMTAVQSASLLVCLGGGYITDADRAQTGRVLDLIEHAHGAGVRVAMVGQGLGPLDDPELRSTAAAVLPEVALIALRERKRGPALLQELGVSAEKVTVTGDDAIELAYQRRRDEIGEDLGLCVRMAGYSPVSLTARSAVGRIARIAASKFGARLAPLVIAEYKSQDRRSTLPLVRDYPNVRRPPARYARPLQIASRISQCRVVITGAYHLAVFALSQGIPVVALTSSAYYDSKFLGLADMFDSGLQLVDLTAPDLDEDLLAAIRSAWKLAPEVREPLRARARAQILDSRAGFERVFQLAESAQSAQYDR